MLQMLREKHRPSCLDFYCGKRTEGIWRFDPTVDRGFLAFNSSEVETSPGDELHYNLVVNIESTVPAKQLCASLATEATFICGPCLDPDGASDLPFGDDPASMLATDPDWTARDLCDRHPCLSTAFIGEILCRIAYLDGPIPDYSVGISEPVIGVPDVLISTAASLTEKLWSTEKWIEAARWLTASGLTIGLVGAKPDAQRMFWLGGRAEDEIVSENLAVDLRGALTLPEVVGALKRARICLTVDNGILHLASAVRTPTVGLFRNGIHRLWAPRISSLSVLTPNPGQPVDRIELSSVIDALGTMLNREPGQ